jgi:hypothetical protein
MGCLYCPPKADIGQLKAADCDVIVCYGATKLTDKHLAATVHCVDDEIIAWLKDHDRDFGVELHGSLRRP